jgi:branched-chain amino acid aminotransferase
MNQSMGIVLYNGEFQNSDAVGIDPTDRGFLLGDGVFDTMLAVDGVPVFAEDHGLRLMRHAKILGIPCPLDCTLFTSMATTLLQKNGYTHGRYAIRTTLTRGPGPRGLKIPDMPPLHPTLLMHAAPALIPQGHVNLIVAQSVRRNEGSPLSQVKTLNYADNILALHEALAAGANDAVILNNRGQVCCAASSNIFAVLDGQWATPPLTDGVLDGIMRAKTIAEKKVLEISLYKDDLIRASALYLTNSLTGLRPARLIAVSDSQ